MLRRARLSFFALALALLVPSPATADHVPTMASAGPGFPADAPSIVVGDWRLIAHFPAGAGLGGVDWDAFKRDGRRYVVASSQSWGLTVFDVTDPAAPVRISDYASAVACPHGAAAHVADEALHGHSHPSLIVGPPFSTAEDVGESVLAGFQNDLAITPDGRLALLGTDAAGRCHDPVAGGIEIVDLSDVHTPRLAHLVRTFGMAHSVTIDARGLAFLSTSDSENYVDVVDLRPCMRGGHGNACRPPVGRILFDDAWTRPTGPPPPVPFAEHGPSGCHDIRIAGDRLYCAAVAAGAVVLDISRILDARERLNGTDIAHPSLPGACEIVSADPITAPGARATDCRGWTGDAFVAAGARALPATLVSAIQYGGFGIPGDTPTDVDIALPHQAEAIAQGTMMIVTDERSGGGCPGVGGGIWFYDIRDERAPVLLTRPEGGRAVYASPLRPDCDVHYGAAVQDEDLLVMAWYNAGTHVLRVTPDLANGKVQVTLAAAYAPAGAYTSTSKALGRNPADPDELIILAADYARGFDFLAVRLPRTEEDDAQGAAPVAPTALVALAIAFTGSRRGFSRWANA